MSRKCKQKKCRQCGAEFWPFTSTQNSCSISCAIEIVKDKNARLLNRAVKASKAIERKSMAKRKEKMKKRSEWIKELQVLFNRFIRLRDKDEPCISCGRYDHEIKEYLRGGKWDCGHYLSVGSHPELRFTEMNAHKQCKSDNGGAGKYTKKNHTVQQSYRINLIGKIGQKNMDILEGPHEPLKLDIDQIKELKQKYKDKIKLLK